MGTRNDFQRIYNPTSSLEIYDQAEFEDYIPDLENFVSSIVSLEDKSLRDRAIPEGQILGHHLVNRTYLSAITDFYIRKFKFEIGIIPDTEKEYFRMLYDYVNPKELLLPIHIHRKLISAIRCYSPHGTPTIRVPRSDPGIICSHPIYHAADMSRYNHVYLPFEYERLPATVILARLLYLIKHRERLLPTVALTGSLPVVTFLLFGDTSEREIRITSESNNPDAILQRLVNNIFFSDFPDCTAEALADSIDAMPNEAIPELEMIHKYVLPSLNSTRPHSAMTPSKQWFTDNSMFKTSHGSSAPDISLVHYLPQSNTFGRLPLTANDIHPVDVVQPQTSQAKLHTASFWMNVLQSQ